MFCGVFVGGVAIPHFSPPEVRANTRHAREAGSRSGGPLGRIKPKSYQNIP
jgi:hypothetical protein